MAGGWGDQKVSSPCGALRPTRPRTSAESGGFARWARGPPARTDEYALLPVTWRIPARDDTTLGRRLHPSAQREPPDPIPQHQNRRLTRWLPTTIHPNM